MKKMVALALAGLSSVAAFAEGEVTLPTEVDDMFTSATGLVTACREPLSTMMLTAFGIVLIFVAYKLAKRAINKV